MKLSHIIAAAGLALAATGAAQAQPPMHDQSMHDHGMMHQRTVVTTRHTEVTRHGMGFRHHRCHMEYHHHHRVRVCR